MSTPSSGRERRRCSRHVDDVRDAWRRLDVDPVVASDRNLYRLSARESPAPMILHSLKGALRSLRAAPAFATLVILTMAVAIALSSLVLGTVNAVVRPVRVVQGQEQLYRIQAIGTAEETAPSEANLRQLRAAAPSIEALTTFRGEEAVIASRGESQQRFVMYVDEDYFEVLGARASIGRVFAPADHRFGESPLSPSWIEP